MTRSRKRKLRRVATQWAGVPLASAALLAGSSMAHAQQAAAPEGTLEEIVVTAQKRSEDLQKVPISLQVLGGEKLDQLQVTSFDDYARFLPSVSYQSLGPSQAQLYFRGISSGGDGLHAGSLPATGMYLDETPVTTIGNTLDIHMYDIARVEALAGPQGTLYGASSLSGTLRVITNRPDPSKFSASFDVKGTKFAEGDPGGALEGYVNIPISDKVAVRLVGYYDKEGGYINNVPASATYARQTFDYTDPQNPVLVYDGPPFTRTNANVVKPRANDVTSYGGRAALKWDFADHWSVTPTVIYQNQKANGNFSYNPKLGYLNIGDYTPGINEDHWYQSALTVEGKIGNYDLVYSGGYFERKVDNVVDYADYGIAYDQFGSGYSRFDDGAGGLLDPTQYTSNHDKYTKLNQEIRISSPAENRLRFVAGGFMQRQSDKIRAEFRVDGLRTLDTVPAARPDVYVYAVDGQPGILYLSQQTRTDRDYAVFGDATFDLNDQWKISAGLRQFWVDNTLYGFFGFQSGNSGEGSCYTPAGPGVTIPNYWPCVNTNKKVTESGQTGRVVLTYQIDPDHMVYGTYSKGYRPGGNNRRVEVVAYQADKLTNYEIGWKTAWLDHRLRFNGAAFFEQWDGVQFGLQGVNGITSILNAGKAEVVGVEFDVSMLVGENTTLSVSGTNVDAKTTTNFCPAPTGVVTSNCGNPKASAGTQLPVTPRFKINGIARYKFNWLGNESFVQGAVVHQGSSTYTLEQATNDLVGPTPAYTSFDFSIGTQHNKWSLEAYVQNIFQEHGELARVSECAATYCYQNVHVYPIKPMNFGIKFGQKF